MVQVTFAPVLTVWAITVAKRLFYVDNPTWLIFHADFVAAFYVHIGTWAGSYFQAVGSASFFLINYSVENDVIACTFVCQWKVCLEDLLFEMGVKFDYIIFYRWYTSDGGFPRGRIMARLVTEMIEKASGQRVWLDQREMARDTSPDRVVCEIAEAFQHASQVVILAAPGDWERFANSGDIHHWEWQLSLQSEKPVWILRYASPIGSELHSMTEFRRRLEDHNPHLAELVGRRHVHVRSLCMDNFDGVLMEVAGVQ